MKNVIISKINANSDNAETVQIFFDIIPRHVGISHIPTNSSGHKYAENGFSGRGKGRQLPTLPLDHLLDAQSCVQAPPEIALAAP